MLPLRHDTVGHSYIRYLLNVLGHNVIYSYVDSEQQETSAIAEKPSRRHVAGQRAWPLKGVTQGGHQKRMMSAPLAMLIESDVHALIESIYAHVRYST